MYTQKVSQVSLVYFQLTLDFRKLLLMGDSLNVVLCMYLILYLYSVTGQRGHTRRLLVEKVLLRIICQNCKDRECKMWHCVKRIYLFADISSGKKIGNINLQERLFPNNICLLGHQVEGRVFRLHWSSSQTKFAQYRIAQSMFRNVYIPWYLFHRRIIFICLK